MNPERTSGFVPQPELISSPESLPSSALRVTKKVGGIISEAYFSPKPWEGDGRIYRWVGIRTFKRWIPSGDVLIRFMRRNTGEGVPFYSLHRPNIKEAKKYDRSTRVFETVHAAGLASFAAGLAGYGGPSLGIDLPSETYINAAAVAGNLYAVMLQRYNRARIYDLVKRGKKIANRSTPPRALVNPHPGLRPEYTGSIRLEVRGDEVVTVGTPINPELNIIVKPWAKVNSPLGEALLSSRIAKNEE